MACSSPESASLVACTALEAMARSISFKAGIFCTQPPAFPAKDADFPIDVGHTPLKCGHIVHFLMA